MPHQPALRDVSTLRRIDRVEMPDAFTVLGILAISDVYAVLDDDGRPDQLVTSPRPHRIFWIGIELPQFLPGERLVAAHPSVTLGGDNLHDAPNGADRRRGPLPVQDSVLDRIILPKEHAAFLIESDDRWSAGGRYVDVA